jgi:hypothetical protein
MQTCTDAHTCLWPFGSIYNLLIDRSYLLHDCKELRYSKPISRTQITCFSPTCHSWIPQNFFHSSFSFRSSSTCLENTCNVSPGYVQLLSGLYNIVGYPCFLQPCGLMCSVYSGSQYKLNISSFHS